MSSPKGTLIPIGGAERRLDPESSSRARRKLHVLRRVVEEMQGQSSHIEIIPTASGVPIEVAKAYERSFSALEVEEIGVMNIRRKEQADQSKYLDRLESAGGIMLTGGDQRKLIRAFHGTEFLRILKERYQNEPGFVIAGTSAGAMAMSPQMIFGGMSKGTMLRGKAKITEGLGLIDSAIIDSHFVIRGRFGRMAVAVSEFPDKIGIGLGEDTGVVIKKERYLECIGSGHVSIYDASEMKNLSQDEFDDQFPATFERMIFHVLSKGYQFDLKKRKFMPAKAPA
jgi:cyanophycinase